MTQYSLECEYMKLRTKIRPVLFKCLAQVKNNCVTYELKYVILSAFVPLFIEKETVEDSCVDGAYLQFPLICLSRMLGYICFVS